jgi:hypothetical protein
VAFHVAIGANGSAYKSSCRTLVMNFPTKSIFSDRAIHSCCLVSLFAGIADAATDVGIGGCGLGGVFGRFEMRTCMQVFMENEVVEVIDLAKHVRGLRGMGLLGCEVLVRSGTGS